jgi:CubicO group peptidase (beta-lactamase class C family)
MKGLSFIFLALFRVNGLAQPAATERIDSFLLVMAQNHLFNGSVLVAEHGKLIYKKSYGYADFDKKNLNSDTTCFNLASLSKPFTAIAVLQLVQKGKISLDDPFLKYFPDFPYPAIRIRHLLSHTSGLPQVEKFEMGYIQEHPDEILSSDKVYADLLALKMPLAFQPGDSWSYSNIGYTFLALLVQRVSRMPFADYMKKFVFIPSGMYKTYIRSTGSPNTPRYIIPTLYDSTYKNVDSLDHRKIYTNYHLGGLAGSNNVISTLEDLFSFDKAFSAGKLISLQLIEQVFTPVILNNGKPFHMRGGFRSYGFGWNVMDEPSKDKVVFHDGHIVGITTMLYKNLPKGQTIIFYDNTDEPRLIFQQVGTIARILNHMELNKISLAKSLARVYGEALVTKGVDFAMAKFFELKDDTVNYYIDESEMNTLGYDLLGNKSDFAGHQRLALEVFKINTLLFHTANAYDSYGDALAANGDKESAMAMYKKSIALDPKNEEEKNKLKKMLGEN